MGFKTVEFNSTDEATSSGDSIVGRFRAGYQVNDRPVSLAKFRVTTEERATAEAVGELLGYDVSIASEPAKWDTESSQVWEVFTAADTVDVLLDGPGSVKSSLVMWGRVGKILETDGQFLYNEQGELTDEPSVLTQGKSFQELKAMHRAGKGPGPSLQAYFRLAASPELGKFSFYSGSWSAIKAWAIIEEKMVDADPDTPARLILDRREVMTPEGDEFKFSAPVLKL